MRIIDCHIHCGDCRRTKYFSAADVERNLAEAGAQGAVIFAFPEDMYRIADSPESRTRANRYVLEVARARPSLIPFYYVWNDYVIPDNLADYAGIKWHRHWNEPRYDYADPRCEEVLKAIRALSLPVLIEEEFAHTAAFVARNPGLPIIIPHMGLANGGTDKMHVFFSNPDVCFDTAVAPLDSIRRVLDAVGPDRILFGSDVSGTHQPFFNFTKVELEKVLRLGLSDQDLQKVLAGNLECLLSQRRKSLSCQGVTP